MVLVCRSFCWHSGPTSSRKNSDLTDSAGLEWLAARAIYDLSQTANQWDNRSVFQIESNEIGLRRRIATNSQTSSCSDTFVVRKTSTEVLRVQKPQNPIRSVWGIPFIGKRNKIQLGSSTWCNKFMDGTRETRTEKDTSVFVQLSN